MKLATRWLVLSIVTVMAAYAYSGGVEHPPSKASMSAEIATAKTRADYEALALRFEQEADALQARADEHLAMAENYEGLTPNLKPLAWGVVMAKHCRRISDDYRSSAKEYRALARLQRKMAQQLTP